MIMHILNTRLESRVQRYRFTDCCIPVLFLNLSQLDLKVIVILSVFVVVICKISYQWLRNHCTVEETIRDSFKFWVGKGSLVAGQARKII